MIKEKKAVPPKASHISISKEGGDVVSMLTSVLNRVEAQSHSQKFFPYGINKVSISLSTPGGASFDVTIEGPSSGAHQLVAQMGEHELFGLSITAWDIPDLNLAPNAKAGAESLKKEFGSSIVFTSGRRSVKDQCRVMAQNIVSTGNRKWIEETYVAGKELQQWVDNNPDADTVFELQAGLESVMNSWDDKKLAKISYHLSGGAFDIQPVLGSDGGKIKSAIKNLKNLNRFLDGENGVAVWHLQFSE